MTNFSELELFNSHIERLKEEILHCKDPDIKKIIQDEINFMFSIIKHFDRETV